jgi:DNA-binding MurR/RpiR family transcriptional regulator
VHYRNASELAHAAEVSVMSAYRFVRQLRQGGFLDGESEILRLSPGGTDGRWQAANLRSVPDVPLHWISSANKKQQIVGRTSLLRRRPWLET